MRKRILAFGVVLILASSCRCRGPEGTTGPLPLEAPSAQISLPVPGHLAAAAELPLGAREPRPLLIALHGAESPEEHCRRWRSIARERGFVLCPRGTKLAGSSELSGQFGWTSLSLTGAEVRGALKALKQAYPAHVASGPVVVAGFDGGALHVEHLVREEPAFFARVALVSSKALTWSATLSAVYAERGGQRVLMLCTSTECDNSAARAEGFLRSYGLAVRRVFLADVPSVLDPRVAQALAAEWPWLVEGAPLWQPK